ncbi:MAG: FCD domain-containing protein [Actinobacteria bacterium]|nr:FCD domain-containing protein [Actinomycetota bacterium]
MTRLPRRRSRSHSADGADRGAVVAADVAFHRAVLDAAGNRFLLSAAEPLLGWIGISLATDPAAAAGIGHARLLHSRIADAIERRDALGDPSIQGVVVDGHELQNVAYARRAMAVGKHVLMEKPLGWTHAQVDELLDTAAASGLVFQMGYHFRWFPHSRRVLDLQARGAFGPVHRVRVFMCSISTRRHQPCAGGLARRTSRSASSPTLVRTRWTWRWRSSVRRPRSRPSCIKMASPAWDSWTTPRSFWNTPRRSRPWS